MKQGWMAKPLSELCNVFTDGDWIESKDQSPSGIRLIQTGNIGDGEFKNRKDKARYIDEATFKRLRCTEIFENDCLISRLPEPVGRSCLIPTTGERMITAVDCTILRFRPDQLLPRFFSFYSQSFEYQKAVARSCSGTTRNRISRKNLGLIPIPVPPLAEQERIVRILDKAFEAIAIAKANTEKNLQNARAIFESYLQSVFTASPDRVAPNKDWQVRQLGDLAELRGRIGWRGLTAKEYTEEGPLFISVHSLNYGDYVDFRDAFHISEERYEESPEIMLEPDDVLICKDGAGIGKTGIVGELPDRATINSSLLLIRSRKEILPKFLFRCLASPYFQRIVQSRLNGATTPHLYQRDIKEFPILLPPIKEQKRIVMELDGLLEATETLASSYEKKASVYKEFKQALLHFAFSGEL